MMMMTGRDFPQALVPFYSVMFLAIGVLALLATFTFGQAFYASYSHTYIHRLSPSIQTLEP